MFLNKLEDSEPWTFGEAIRPGQRTDLEKARDLKIAGASDLDVAMEYPAVSAKHSQWISWVGSLHRSKEATERLKRKYAEMTRRSWQNQVLQDILQQPERTVLWLMDLQGGSGKSTLTGMLAVEGAFVSSGGTVHRDIAYGYDHQEICIFDLSRRSKLPMTLVEEMKNGRVSSDKYKSCIKRPHKGTYCKVAIFANVEPPLKDLSMDRWVVKELKQVAGIWTLITRNVQDMRREQDEAENDQNDYVYHV